jgi:hypothetical protein
VLLAVRIDENRVDDVSYQEDGSVVDEDVQLQDQYTRILNTTTHLESLSAFSDCGVCIGDLPSSPVRSPLHLASLSCEPLRSPYTDGSPTIEAAGPGISLVSSSSMCDSVRDEMLWELKQEFFAGIRSELFRSQQKIAVVQLENAAFRKRIEDLESASLRTSTPASSDSHTSTPVSSTPASSENNTSPDQPVASHLVDPVVSLTQVGDFTEDEARWVLFQSNNIVNVAAEILLSCPPVPSARIRLDESHYRPPRGRRRGGYTPHLFRSSLSVNPVHLQQSVPVAAGSSVRDDQMASTLGKLTDVTDNLGTLMTDNKSRNARSTRDHKLASVILNRD